MTGSKSIILHLDTLPQWRMLSDAQAGALIKALLSYAETGEQLQSDDAALMMAFSFISAQIARDSQKYAKRCETNKRVAEEREERRRAERERKEASENERVQTCTNEHEENQTCTNTTYSNPNPNP
ncbi:MAG: hypothetical protein J6Z40_11530, partial [Oscillospiraceae bacterium]|nr:hypothetical protein [Oscillospiraceae bacterium]